jgi:hypothetical protein
MASPSQRLHDNERKEFFSYAYIRAVCAAAGLAVDRPEVDVDSRDLRIYCRGAAEFYAQVKCTENLLLSENTVTFPLPVSDYEHLRSESAAPAILIVVHVPKDCSDWISQTEVELSLRKCGYWMSLRGLPPTSNQGTVSVQIPREQVFSVDSPWEILEREGFNCEA